MHEELQDLKQTVVENYWFLDGLDGDLDIEGGLETEVRPKHKPARAQLTTRAKSRRPTSGKKDPSPWRPTGLHRGIFSDSASSLRSLGSFRTSKASMSESTDSLHAARVLPTHNPYEDGWLLQPPSGHWILDRGRPRCVQIQEASSKIRPFFFAMGNKPAKQMQQVLPSVAAAPMSDGEQIEMGRQVDEGLQDPMTSQESQHSEQESQQLGPSGEQSLGTAGEQSQESAGEQSQESETAGEHSQGPADGKASNSLLAGLSKLRGETTKPPSSLALSCRVKSGGVKAFKKSRPPVDAKWNALLAKKTPHTVKIDSIDDILKPLDKTKTMKQPVEISRFDWFSRSAKEDGNNNSDLRIGHRSSVGRASIPADMGRKSLQPSMSRNSILQHGRMSLQPSMPGKSMTRTSLMGAGKKEARRTIGPMSNLKQTAKRLEKIDASSSSASSDSGSGSASEKEPESQDKVSKSPSLPAGSSRSGQTEHDEQMSRKQDRENRSTIKYLRENLLVSAQATFDEKVWEECGLEAEHLVKKRLATLFASARPDGEAMTKAVQASSNGKTRRARMATNSTLGKS
eukprot:CAMPEP_0197644328 /NCGR_PEP_ID=MMETSP1338-20131121/17341_1 /TAXON_ID=43686 ORGANISM="Pelagodinium beii, Strain RCC1491" /NCGR_SAMPLE_ID=MMETSP1338 /ASSEMBLY_ACC=CAM_ASM_000754 /LENGTH=570 /DNA_ID=CAMNT_0043217711 /DNA_START=53 /DNA_END=1765 /DNA_ORIENTATION=-